MSTQSSDQHPLASVHFDDEEESSEYGDQERPQAKWTSRDGRVSSIQTIPLQTMDPNAATGRMNRTVSSHLSRCFNNLTKWMNSRDWWPWEILCWSLSLASFGAIVAVLVAFNNKQMPDWPFQITPNGLVSAFATMQTFLLAIPVSEGMGQLKWTWFRRSRKLNMFEAIEGAGRDPIAALTLLLRRQGGWLSAVGALLTIFMLAIGTFYQEILVFENRAVEVPGGASVPIAHSYGFHATNSGPELSMLSALYSSSLNPQYMNVSVTPNCSTGNCTWPKYSSLAVCSACANITDELRESDTRVALPNGFILSNKVWKESGNKHASFVMNATTTYSSSSTEAFDTMRFRNHGTVLIDSFVIAKASRDSQPLAFECILQFCAQTYNASAINGNFTEKIIKNKTLDGTTVMENKDATYKHGLSNPFSYPTPMSNETFTVDALTHNDLIGWFKGAFTGNVSLRKSKLASDSQPTDDYHYTSVIMRSLFQAMAGSHTGYRVSANESSTPLPWHDNLAPLFDNIARSMTVRIRNAYPLHPDHGPSSPPGHASHTVIHLHVRWFWIIGPAILEVLVLVFLVLVVRNSRNCGVSPYKSGLLPVLYHGLEESAREKMEALDQIGEMEDSAGDTYVRLEGSGDAGWRLVPVV